MRWSFSRGRVVVHTLLLLYAIILVYVLLGLLLKLSVSADIFFDLSFALLFFALGQAFYEIGPKNALTFMVVTAAIGFSAEVLGTSTGFPFGKYYYTDFLGPKILGVPEVVPFVWFVIAYLAFSVSLGSFRNGSARSVASIAIVSAFGAVAWDLLVDPMFSTYGYWVWTKQFISLPKLEGIPLTNFIGWFVLVGLMLIVFLGIAPNRAKIVFRRNTFDSRIAYSLLMIDGIVANWELNHILVIGIGVTCMVVFLVISVFFERKYQRVALSAKLVQSS